MKKAKIILTSIAVLAVVGGALAFKATKNGKVLICTDPSNPVPSCTLPVFRQWIETPQNGILTHCSTTSYQFDCTTLTTFES